MKPKITITQKRYFLKSIEPKDIELIRKWKNENREHFFHNEVIDKKSQKWWYNECYKYSKDNYIFIIYKAGLFYDKKVGCIGFRKRSDINAIDIYNFMINKRHQNKGHAKAAMQILIKHIKACYNMPIGLFVRSDNEIGYKWYVRNGFVCQKKDDEYWFLTYCGE